MYTCHGTHINIVINQSSSPNGSFFLFEREREFLVFFKCKPFHLINIKPCPFSEYMSEPATVLNMVASQGLCALHMLHTEAEDHVLCQFQSGTCDFSGDFQLGEHVWALNPKGNCGCDFDFQEAEKIKKGDPYSEDHWQLLLVSVLYGKATNQIVDIHLFQSFAVIFQP